MPNLSEQIVKDLIDQGVNTFFGVQGGACARIIENVTKYKGQYIPVLNEQSAGFYAHGYYMASRKTAGLIFTTGPGLTNGLSGIAACYYDRVPLVALVGQVNSKINIAKSTNTRMVGFQEVPHLDLAKPISDYCLKVDSEKKYSRNRDLFLSNLKNKVQVVEFLDDVQRAKIRSNFKKIEKKKIKKKNVNFDKAYSLINKSNKPVIIVGSGFSCSKKNLDLLSKFSDKNIPISSTWGGQKIQNYSKKIKNFVGLMGNHNPGFANDLILESDLIIALGCSLLQHQVGKVHSNFAPKSKILYINNDLNECKRAKFQFGKRLRILNDDVSSFIKFYSKIKNIKKSILAKRNLKTFNTPVNYLKKIFKNLDQNSIIFSDAGATLSWTYQAANLLKNCPPIFTSFNLHSMGYANCGSVGAKISNKYKNVYCVIGDGSLPMNSQELAWLKKYPVKIILIDNKGYGIIRQTQRLFYKSKFLGSDFLNKKTSLPTFSVESIFKSYSIEFKKLNKNLTSKDISWLNSSKKSKALIINIKYDLEVATENS